METRLLVIKTHLKPAIKRTALVRGTLLGGLGAVIMVLGGIYIPLNSLAVWGLPLFLAGFGLITLGLLPYRKLLRQEQQPCELHLYEARLLFIHKRILLTLPLASIEKMEFQTLRNMEGITVYLKNPVPEKIVLHRQRLSAKQLYYFKNALFFPNFSHRSYEELMKGTKGT